MPLAPVSVVIPSYNCGHLLPQALASVLAQTVRPAEIVVVDDGSTDDTCKRVADYLGRIRYLRQTNQGVSAARNLGVRAAGQEFVAFLDADDVWHPRKLELQTQAFVRYPDLGLLGTEPFDWPTAVFPTLSDTSEPRITPLPWARLVVKNYLITSSVMVRRTVLAAAGEFDRTLQGPEDRDLWLRIAESAPVANLVTPLTGYRDVPGSVSKQAERCEAGMLRILHKLDDRKAWGGRWVLRRKAYGYVYHSCAYLHGAEGAYRRAVLCSLKSFGWYPLPYHRDEVRSRAERPKRAFLNLLRWAGLRPPTAAPHHQPRGT